MRIALLGLLSLSANLLSATGPVEPVESPSFLFYEENIGQAADLLLVRGGAHRAYVKQRELRLFGGGSVDGLAIRFASAAADPTWESEDLFPGRIHRFSGPQAAWRRDIPAHRRVRMRQIQPGVDLILGEKGHRMALTFAVQPGVDPATVVLESSTGETRIDPVDGYWQTRTPFVLSQLILAPTAYQRVDGDQQEVEAAFRRFGANQVGFALGDYDPDRELYIEAVVPDESRFPVDLNPVAATSNGVTYLAGEIPSEAPQQIFLGTIQRYRSDIALAAFDADGVPLFFTVLRGGGDDKIVRLLAAESGTLAAFGNTQSTDFPVTDNAFQASVAGSAGDPIDHLFLAQLDAATGGLLYSTYYDGPNRSRAIDAAWLDGAMFTALAKAGPDFPTTPGAWMRSGPSGGSEESVILQFDFDAGRPVFATYAPDALLSAVAVHSDGSVYAVGSPRWDLPPPPATPGAVQTFLHGPSDAYILRLAPDGTAPIFATFYGKMGPDGASSIVVSETGEAWVYGEHVDYAILDQGVEPSVFVARLSADGSRIESMEFPAEREGLLLPDSSGGVLLYSKAYSPSLPTTADAPIPGGCGDRAGHAFLRRFGPDGEPSFATYLPGSAMRSLDLRPAGRIAFVDGQGQLFRMEDGQLERYVADHEIKPALSCATHAASRFNEGRITPGNVVTLIGTGMGPEQGVSAEPSGDRYPVELGGVRVLINGIAAPLLYVQSRQINAVAPYDLPEGSIEIVIERDGAALEPLKVQVVSSDFHLFTLDGSGLGQLAVFNQDGSLNGPRNPAPGGSIVVLYGTGAGRYAADLVAGALTPMADPPRIPGVEIQVYDRHETDVLYAGGAPGLLNSLVQINVRLPDDENAGFTVVRGRVGFPFYGAPMTRIWTR